MTALFITEDQPSTKECRRAFTTIELNDTHFVDIMISEECHTIYAMQNADGTEVYDSKGVTCKNFSYNKKKAFKLAREAFKKEYGREPNI